MIRRIRKTLKTTVRAAGAVAVLAGTCVLTVLFLFDMEG